MSEAELHVIRARLQGGILNKARRGELQCPLPVGLVYSAEGRPMLDPDKQVQDSIRFLFDAFRRGGSACAVVNAFRQKRLLFPRRLTRAPNKGELVWAELGHSRVLYILHNPRYAGAFVFGRNRTRIKPDGSTSYTKLPRDQWTLLKDVHPGYIGWTQYEENNSFTSKIVARIRRRYDLPPRYDRLRKAGMLTVDEMATMLGITPQWVKIWNRHGLLRGHPYNDGNDRLFEHPGDNPPAQSSRREAVQTPSRERGRSARYPGGAV